ncbi:MAG: MlaD family protein [Candidatus Binatia bacterium]
MSKKSNPITIGAFVVGAITLAIIGLMVFGSGRFFRETYEYILYFESDVSGLSKGANVKLKGVSIGTVNEVLLNVGDMSALSGKTAKWYVPVIISLDADKTSALGSTAKPDPETVAGLVERGMRAQLASESLVTGVLYVKLDFFPGTRGLRLASEVGAPYPEIPTLPTQLEEVTTKAMQFLADLQLIDLRGLVEEIKGATVSARTLLESPGLQQAIDNLDDTLVSLDSTLASVREAAESAQGVMDPLGEQMEPTLVDLRATLADLRSTVNGAGAILKPDSPLIVALQKTLEDAAVTVKTIKDFAALLERNPDALLRGKGTPKEKR